MLKTQRIDYQDDTVLLEGYYAYDDSHSHKRPGVMVCHDWSGKNEFACQKAEQLAELGYVGFAIDMYGKGKNGKTKEEKSALMLPLVQHRDKLQRRVLAGFNTLQALPLVNANQLGAIGFCFGGLCALDLARSGAKVTGVVSFHGLLNAPENLPQQPILANILALHGYDDPMATPDQVMKFAQEMTQSQAAWQIDMYGHTQHAFTNPEANDRESGLIFNKTAASRSWQAMQLFFKEIFS